MDNKPTARNHGEDLNECIDMLTKNSYQSRRGSLAEKTLNFTISFLLPFISFRALIFNRKTSFPASSSPESGGSAIFFRTPPSYPDLYGRYRKQAELQNLDREITYLQEELRSLESLPPASICCKEVDDFVGINPDPMIPINHKVRRSYRIWKIFRVCSCFNFSWICCCKGCSIRLEKPRCLCKAVKKPRCLCRLPSCRSCCKVPSLPRPKCSSCCACSFSKCTCIFSCPNCWLC
ncbi:guanine nucleotide-binding protein subunit gamma 3 isoform X1 [Amborella trichopoda]|uniref:guanine nucleotide-binding protein subunit gamma 3 isoform X1 n=1 Tax=Amborella trichopoda TaxID=13333 RepID=UPI0005D3F518|nr:guanine nucleotide-binding protein subunit gamma 3 isoform X1 [Amborella trichopoda]|eukprot:XP_006849716.2 guanine nucleotide-binding protein subunit gamma 3 isoform X1 [Amborella trichopoda]